MKVTKLEQKKLINTIADGLDSVAALMGGSINGNHTKNNGEALADLIDDLTILLQILNNADIIEKKEYLF